MTEHRLTDGTLRPQDLSMPEISEPLSIAEVERRLTSKYAHTISPDQISAAVQTGAGEV